MKRTHNISWLYFLNNKGELPPTPDPEPNSESQPDPDSLPNVTPDPNAMPASEPGAFDSFVEKKGFKNNDAVAKSYEEIEAAHHRTSNTFNTVKQQLEGAGYTVDEKGNVVQTGQPPLQQPQQPYQQQAEPVYDPYTGQAITDPIALQLAQMPVGQREAFIFNAMADQREKLTNSSFKAEQEIINSPAAKGFEQDVKNVMMQVPLQQRANKESWERALFEVKGRRYDNDRQNWGKQGVDDFINKEGAQGLPPSAGGGVSVKLTAEQETTYKWYQDNRPGTFKDKAHFLKANTPTGGR